MQSKIQRFTPPKGATPRGSEDRTTKIATPLTEVRSARRRHSHTPAPSASPDRPLLTGFDAGTWTVIFLQALGGLITAMVIKHAGNMPKAFASAFSLALATSVLMVAVDLDQSSPPLFGLGAVIIVGATLTFETRQVATCATWYMFTLLQRSPSVHGTFPCTRTAHAMM